MAARAPRRLENALRNDVLVVALSNSQGFANSIKLQPSEYLPLDKAWQGYEGGGRLILSVVVVPRRKRRRENLTAL